MNATATRTPANAEPRTPLHTRDRRSSTERFAQILTSATLVGIVIHALLRF